MDCEAAPNPHALFEASAAQPRRPQGMRNTFMPHPAINLLICSSLTTTSKKYLDVAFTSMKCSHLSQFEGG